MKKTFTISLGHSVFNVEEDAYEILKMYLDSIKNYFQKMENDSEIISDFELRIAENFSSKLSSGKQYINLSDVKEVIQIMGSLDDFQEIYNDTENETENIILKVFTDPKMPFLVEQKLNQGKLGEVILNALLQFETGIQGDLKDLSESLSTLNLIGLKNTARRAALTHLVLLNEK